MDTVHCPITKGKSWPIQLLFILFLGAALILP